MKQNFASDNGAPCWKCGGTIYWYLTDDRVSLIDVHCVSCGARDLFRAAVNEPLGTAAEISAAHRQSRRIG